MVHKILVINFIKEHRSIFAKALSNISGYDLLQNRTIYEWKHLFHIEEDYIDAWENQFLIISSSFFEQINLEHNSSNFISIGASCCDVLALKSRLEEKTIELSSDEIMMLESLLNIIGRYTAKKNYQVIHICNVSTKTLDELSVRFYKKYNIDYRLYNDYDNIKNILEYIVQDFEISVLESLESAIYKAEKIVTYKNQKL